MSQLWFDYEDLTEHLITHSDRIKDTPTLKKLFNKCTVHILPSGIMKLGYNSYGKDFKIEYEEPLFNSELYDTFIKLLNDRLDEMRNDRNDVSNHIKDIMHELFNMNFNFKTGLPLKGQLGHMYSKSFFPTYRDVVEELKLDIEKRDEYKINNIYQAQILIDRIFNISQRDLFHYFPGMYYNASCRNICEFGNNSNIQLRRELSFNAFNKMNINTDNSYKRSIRSYKSHKRSRSPKSHKSHKSYKRSRSSKSTLKSLPRNRKSLH
jgi:hypothetical protein